MTIDIATFVGFGGVPIVMALLQIAKSFIPDKRYWPLASIVLGVVWCVGVRFVLGGPLEQATIEGILVGLAASGIWSGGKAMAGL